MNRYAIFAAALLTSAASPCLAASDQRLQWQGVERRSGGFAGLAFKMPLGSAGKATPTARLKLGLTQTNRAAGSAVPLSTSFQGSALEVGLLGRKPMLFLGGHSTKSLKQRAQLNGGNSWLYIAGGVLVAGAAAFLIFADDGTDAEPCIPGNC
jgi:hypothetical protein